MGLDPKIDYWEENNKKIINALHNLYKIWALKVEIKFFEEITWISISSWIISIWYCALTKGWKIIRKWWVTILSLKWWVDRDTIFDAVFSKFPTEEEKEKTRVSVYEALKNYFREKEQRKKLH